MQSLRKTLGLEDDATPHQVTQVWRRLHRRLGLQLGTSPAEVHRAWQRLAPKLHPDANPGDPEASKRFRLAKEADQVLADPAMHAAYAELVAVASTARVDVPPGPWVPPGQDLEAVVPIDLTVAIRGGDWRYEIDLGEYGSRVIRCQLPPGCPAGSQIRVVGEGAEGDPPGDLWVTITHKPHPTMRLDGLDVHDTLVVTAADLYEGASVDVVTPWETATIRLRAADRRRLRVKGHGVRRGARRGALVLTLDVRWPPPGDPELAAALRRLQPHDAPPGNPPAP